VIENTAKGRASLNALMNGYAMSGWGA